MKNDFRSISTKAFFYLFIMFFTATFLSAQSTLDPNAKTEIIASNIGQPEGPVWKDGIGLLFSDILNSKIYLWTSGNTSSIYLTDSDSTNGLTYDLQGRLVAGQMGKRRIVRFESDGTQTDLASKYNGKRFNSPNDLVMKSDGSIFFTDPDFNIPVGGTAEIYIDGKKIKGIFRISPAGNIQLLDGTFDKPNGICFSPDEKKLYVNESPKGDIYVWDVIDDTAIANKKWFAKHKNGGYVDGMKTDTDGNLYCTGPKGIEVFSPAGTSVGFITLPNNNSASNICWGEADRKTLFITCGGQNKPVFRVRPFLTDAKKDEGNLLPDKFELKQNYPNPFNPETRIGFQLPVASYVTLRIYDSLGKEIAKLVNDYKQPGSYTAQLSTNDFQMTSGVYYYTLSVRNILHDKTASQSGGAGSEYIATKKMLFLK